MAIIHGDSVQDTIAVQ